MVNITANKALVTRSYDEVLNRRDLLHRVADGKLFEH
jgi:hypothetical protein